MASEQDRQEKRAFAQLLLRTPEAPFKAAIEMFPQNTSRALWISVHWPNDPIVIEAMEEIKDNHGDLAGLPDKAELLRALWNRSQKCEHDDDYVKLVRLYSEIRSFIQKPSPAASLNVVVPKTIEVPTHESDEEWELRAASQQQALLDVSRNRH